MTKTPSFCPSSAEVAHGGHQLRRFARFPPRSLCRILTIAIKRMCFPRAFGAGIPPREDDEPERWDRQVRA